jgi:hypothetical protein
MLCSLCFILLPLFLFFLLLPLHLIVFLFICRIFSSSQAPFAFPLLEEDCRFILAWSQQAKAVLVMLSCFKYFPNGLIKCHDSRWGNQRALRERWAVGLGCGDMTEPICSCLLEHSCDRRVGRTSKCMDLSSNLPPLAENHELVCWHCRFLFRHSNNAANLPAGWNQSK